MNKLTPEVIYRNNFKAVVLDHLHVAGIYNQQYETDAYNGVRDLLSHEHVLSTDPRYCSEANDLLWSAPDGWQLVPKELDALSTNVPIACIMQEDQSAEYDWIYESSLHRAGL